MTMSFTAIFTRHSQNGSATSSRLGLRLGMAPRRFLAGLAVLISLCISAPSTRAHEAIDPDAAWYNTLRDEGGASCCGQHKDCKAVDDYKASSVPGGYLALVDGEWADVPPQKVLQRADNPTGHAVICVMYYNGHPTARCFVRATEG